MIVHVLSRFTLIALETDIVPHRCLKLSDRYTHDSTYREVHLQQQIKVDSTLSYQSLILWQGNEF